ncbi:sodium:solute symporter family protein [Okeania sp.]|uniref:sodium:solute symporter family protein n=1 Tax=Okeania sp. TaxID=3100323 RepID=UPI002B4B8C0B|nr:sodium:solute symporter family protein [Okeania sp.]MEB3342051.1 sodium:solute symporter family protein [Okeania sp.]
MTFFFFPSSTETWTLIFVTISLMLYLYIGWRSRVQDSQGFFVADRGVPAIANGAATAADFMSAVSFISLAGAVSILGYDGSYYVGAATGGYILLGLLLAPYLRKFGKYTLPDFIGDRYHSNIARIIAVIGVLIISITFVVGQMRGVGIVFSRFLQVPIETGVIIGMIIVAFFAILGGMKGITWTQVVQYFILIVAYLAPVIAICNILTNIPIPQLAFTFSDIIEKLNQVQVDLGFPEYTAAFTQRSMLDVLFITISGMVGLASLPHVIVRFYTVPNVTAARYSVAWALLFIAIFSTTIPALAATARYNLIDNLHNKTVEEVQQLDWARKWQNTGLLEFTDKNNDGYLQLTPDTETNEIILDPDIISLSTPEVAKLSPWLIALVATGGLAAALSTASGLLLVISSAIAHDVYYCLINPKASESQRLIVGRIMIILAIAFAGYFGINPPGFVIEIATLGVGVAAGTFFPAIILGVFDKRTNREGAVSGMIVGLVFTTIYIIGIRFYGMPTWFFGISDQGIGAVGMLLNFVVTLVISSLTTPPPLEIQEMVEELRIPLAATLPLSDIGGKQLD